MEQEISGTTADTGSTMYSSKPQEAEAVTASESQNASMGPDQEVENVISEEILGLLPPDGELSTNTKDELRLAIYTATAPDIAGIQEAAAELEPVQSAGPESTPSTPAEPQSAPLSGSEPERTQAPSPVSALDDSLTTSNRIKTPLPDDVTALITCGSSLDFKRSPVGAIKAAIHYTRPGEPITIDLERKLSLDPDAPTERVKLLLDLAQTLQGNDPHNLFVQKHFTKSVNDIATKLERIIAKGHADLGKSQEIANFGGVIIDVLKPEKGPKREPAHMHQLREISAQNSTLFFDTKGSQEHMLDGVIWRDCKDLTVAAPRSLAHEARGRFGVNAHGMRIIGGSGSLTFKGIDCSEMEVKGLGEGSVKWLQFIQCQLRGARVADECTVHTLNLKDSFLSEGADLSRLQVKNPPASDTEFKALFNGLVISGEVSFHPSWKFEDFAQHFKPVDGKIPELNTLSERQATALLLRSNVFNAQQVGQVEGERIFKIEGPEHDLVVTAGSAKSKKELSILQVKIREKGAEGGVVEQWDRESKNGGDLAEIITSLHRARRANESWVVAWGDLHEELKRRKAA